MKVRCAIALLLLAGRVWATPVALPDRLQVSWLQGADVLATIGYCIPDFTPQQLEDLREKAAKSSVVMRREGRAASPYLLASGDRVVCIDRNGPSKPLLPPSFIAKIISLEGASTQTLETLFRGLAEQLATRGAADGLVKFTNGNAYEIILTAVDDAPVDIMYSVNFLKAGGYDESKYRVVVSDQIRSVTVTSYGGSGRRVLNILQDELAPRPMLGEHLLIQGNAETGQYAFADTAWSFRDSGTVRLRANGVTAYQPKQGNETLGKWQIHDGVMYFNYGKVFGSAILQKDRLLVQLRSLPNAVFKQERRWEATLEKGWF